MSYKEETICPHNTNKNPSALEEKVVLRTETFLEVMGQCCLW